jgi:FkbM family methyltransferase
MSVQQAISKYYGSFGIKGVMALTSYKLCGHPLEITAHPNGIRFPVHLRMRTGDCSVYGMVLLRGEYDFELPWEPKVIVDAGANIGTASIYFANRYPNARIFAIEPEMSNFGMLVRNVSMYQTVKPLRHALWYRTEELNVLDPWNDTCGFTVGHGKGEKTTSVTVSDLMQKFKLNWIDILKVDIEGAEKEVFEHSAEWIDRVGCVMVETHDRDKPGCSGAVAGATKSFTKTIKGETECYIRKDAARLETAGAQACGHGGFVDGTYPSANG